MILFLVFLVLRIIIFNTALTSLRKCYDGTRRSPWNEIECGDYYARAMAAFLYFEIASGQVWMSLSISSFLILFGFFSLWFSTWFCHHDILCVWCTNFTGRQYFFDIAWFAALVKWLFFIPKQIRNLKAFIKFDSLHASNGGTVVFWLWGVDSLSRSIIAQ